MEGLKQAVITPNKRVCCPYCGKLAFILNDGAYVKNLKVRCRGSRHGLEHFFIVSGGNEE